MFEVGDTIWTSVHDDIIEECTIVGIIIIGDVRTYHLHSITLCGEFSILENAAFASKEACVLKIKERELAFEQGLLSEISSTESLFSAILDWIPSDSSYDVIFKTVIKQKAKELFSITL